VKLPPLPDWIVNPLTLPSDKVGKSNCTFGYGLLGAIEDFHPTWGCWECPGPDGWIRQQFQNIHVPRMRQCDGLSGDATAIRVCRPGGEGQLSPCHIAGIDTYTGPNGCARCLVYPMCHPRAKGRVRPPIYK
jgi:hypothetical protein